MVLKSQVVASVTFAATEPNLLKLGAQAKPPHALEAIAVFTSQLDPSGDVINSPGAITQNNESSGDQANEDALAVLPLSTKVQVSPSGDVIILDGEELDDNAQNK